MPHQHAFSNTTLSDLAGLYQYGKATFRVAELGQWTTIVNKTELIEEIRTAPEDRFSLMKAVDQVRPLISAFAMYELLTSRANRSYAPNTHSARI